MSHEEDEEMAYSPPSVHKGEVMIIHDPQAEMITVYTPYEDHVPLITLHEDSLIAFVPPQEISRFDMEDEDDFGDG